MHQQTREVSVNASRGTIYDKNHNILASSTTAEKVILDPLRINQFVQAQEKAQDEAALKALELAREQGVKKNQDAEVTLTLDGETFAAWEKGSFLPGFDEADLATLFIVSKVTVEQGSGVEVAATVKLSEVPKCPRCWNHDGHIGEAGHHGELCDRCAAVLAKEG